jgi:hypothetical protein
VPIAGYAGNVGQTVAGYAGNVGQTVAGYAGGVGQAVAERSGDLARQAQTTLLGAVGRVVQDQPLLVAALGLAAGAAVAAMFPATELERRSLRPVAERFSDAAASATERITAGAAAAGERLIGAAAEHGLDPEGMKEIARETGSAFGEAFAQQQPGADQSSGASPAHSGRTS